MIYLLMVLSILVTALISYLTSDWYWIIVIPALFGAGFRKFRDVLISGILTGIAAWGLPALFMYLTDSGITGDRVADIFQLGSGWGMVIATAIIGSVFALSGTATGYYLVQFFRDEIKKQNS